MSRRVVILDSAKEDFKDIRTYVRKKFGESVWKAVSAEYKASIKLIKEDPQIGGHIDELKVLGIANIRYALVRQTRIVYEFDENVIIIHLFIGTRRDFRAHLLKRLLSH